MFIIQNGAERGFWSDKDGWTPTALHATWFEQPVEVMPGIGSVCRPASEVKGLSFECPVCSETFPEAFAGTCGKCRVEGEQIRAAARNRKLFKTTLVIEILSADEPFVFNDYADLGSAVIEGDCSGLIRSEELEEVDQGTFVRLCAEHSSDPSFFQIEAHEEVNCGE